MSYMLIISANIYERTWTQQIIPMPFVSKIFNINIININIKKKLIQ